MAEWLGRALQKLLQRFESASDLNRWIKPRFRGFVVLLTSEAAHEDL